MTIYSAGLGLGELLILALEDIDFDGDILNVRRGKGKKDRRIIPDVRQYLTDSPWYNLFHVGQS